MHSGRFETIAADGKVASDGMIPMAYSICSSIVHFAQLICFCHVTSCLRCHRPKRVPISGQFVSVRTVTYRYCFINMELEMTVCAVDPHDGILSRHDHSTIHTYVYIRIFSSMNTHMSSICDKIIVRKTFCTGIVSEYSEMRPILSSSRPKQIHGY